MSLVPGANQQRVVGWLALTLQRRYGLLAGWLTEYTVTDAGHVELLWRGGPLPADVAAALVAAAEPDMLVVHHAKSSGTIRANLTVGGIPVALLAYDPDPSARPEQVPAHREWSFPLDVLADVGAALDCVLWHVPPDPGGVGSATVVRLPPHIRGRDWPEGGHLVVHTGHIVPTYAAAEHHNAWRGWDSTASIRLRAAAPGWTDDTIDAWLETEVSRWPRPFIAAVVDTDRCVMRDRYGRRIEATSDDQRQFTPAWSIVPSVVLSALCHMITEQREPPATLIIRAFGGTYGENRVKVDTTLTAPVV